MQPAADAHGRCASRLASAAALRAACLLALVLTSACNNIRNEQTVSSLEQAPIIIEDEKIDGSLHEAMDNYRKYLQQSQSSQNTAEAIRRLADLEIESSYLIEGVEAPDRPGASAAIEHYTHLLAAYPLYEHNDLVLYQLSRAYEEAGDNTNAVKSLEKILAEYPGFERMDEVNFRLGEHYFRNRDYSRAINAYGAVIRQEKDSSFYQSALEKQGWSYFKQDKYHHALANFITVLDYLVVQGYEPGADSKQADDIYLAISLCFTYLGGPSAIKTYIENGGNKLYEQEMYRHLAEYYLSKDRYSDAVSTYQAYIDNHPYSKEEPFYMLRIIEIYQSGDFHELAIRARKSFRVDYGPEASYWDRVPAESLPDAVAYQKTNIRALASYYHSLFQKQNNKQFRQTSYQQAVYWYREYYYLYPLDEHAPQMSKLLAELYLENGDYRNAAVEFERISKNHPQSEIAAESAYAALFAYRENLKSLPVARQRAARESIAGKSLLFAQHYPDYPETAAVLVAAAYDYLLLKNFSAATDTANEVIAKYSATRNAEAMAALIVLADAEFESGQYAAAEQSYSRILAITPADNKSRAALTDNLAASIYKQAKEAKKNNNPGAAAEHFLRLQSMAPQARLSASAQYEAASALVSIGDWKRAAVVLEDFQKQNPSHELAEATTRNLAVIYRKSDELQKSAGELERLARTDSDPQARREALLQAAGLYLEADNYDEALRVYRQYVTQYPSPAEDAVETYYQIASIYQTKSDIDNYHTYLKKTVRADEEAGRQSNERTRYLAAQAMLVLATVSVDRFMQVELSRPFRQKLELKQQKMATSLELLKRLIDYQVSETTTAATYYIAEIYLHFSKELAASERPTELNIAELEQYELALEEQVFMFEEKAINVYEKNTELLDMGIHDIWIEKSIDRLSTLFPAQYAKQEQKSGYLKSLYAEDDRT